MFSVEKVSNEVVILENIQTGEMTKVPSYELKDVKESDIVILNNEKYIYSKDETLKRKEKINKLKNKLRLKK